METILQFLSDILEMVIEADKFLLLDINSQHSPFFDTFMFWVSDKWIWVPMYVAMFYAIVKDKRIETVFIAIGIVLTVLFCDQFSSGLCKPLFERLRPCQDPSISSMVHTVCGFKCDLYGFISSHAANTVGLAVFTTMLFKNGWFNFFIWLWAALNCYSRMYMGVHFPGDILCGAVAGALLGWLCFFIYQSLLKWMPQFRYNPHKTNSRSNIDFPTADIVPFIWTFVTTIFIISIFSASNIFSC